MSSLLDAIERDPSQLFDGTDTAKRYRELVKQCHPDKFAEPDAKRRAEAAFVKLNAYWDSLNGNAAKPVKVGSWTVTRPLVKGDIADLYLVAGNGKEAVLKIAQSPDDNDLLGREYRALKKLRDADCPSTFGRYLPAVLESFEASYRRVNVIELAEDCLSLAHLRDVLGGIPFRHVGWMMNRLLTVLGYAHSRGVIHGAVTPDHLLYRLRDHGLVLVDWCSSITDEGESVPMIVSRWKEHYAPEIRRKRTTYASDIYAAAVAVQYAADSIPARFRPLLDYCLAASPAARPAGAWELQDRWKTLLQEEYGPPEFVELKVTKQ